MEHLVEEAFNAGIPSVNTICVSAPFQWAVSFFESRKSSHGCQKNPWWLVTMHAMHSDNE